MKKSTVLLFTAALLFLTACAGSGQVMDGDGMLNSYRQISQEEARAIMAEDDNCVLVDVRRQDEYDAGHIPGAILIPNESITDTRPEQLQDLDQTILIYCRTGNRSKQAAQKLFDLGYTHVYEFGGIADWTGEIVTETPKAETTGQETASLQFSSFAGGGYEYTVEVEDPSVVEYAVRYDYGGQKEIIDGASSDVEITFSGLKPGETTVTIYGRSPILENDDSIYSVRVDEALAVSLTPIRRISTLFLYRNGKIDYDSYQSSLDGSGYLVSVNDGPEQPMSADAAVALLDVMETWDVAAWDGFEETGPTVPDGEQFWLEVRFTDGTGVQARGEIVCPAHYLEAMDAMLEILDATQKP